MKKVSIAKQIKGSLPGIAVSVGVDILKDGYLVFNGEMGTHEFGKRCIKHSVSTVAATIGGILGNAIFPGFGGLVGGFVGNQIGNWLTD